MCEYCENKKRTLYQTSHYVDLYLDWFGTKPVLIVYASKCPPYAKCVARDMNVGITYNINFCPECGAKLLETE